MCSVGYATTTYCIGKSFSHTILTTGIVWLCADSNAVCSVIYCKCVYTMTFIFMWIYSMGAVFLISYHNMSTEKEVWSAIMRIQRQDAPHSPRVLCVIIRE